MYVNHIFSLRLKRYGSQKKAARMAAEGVQKMSKYVKPVISLDEGMAEGVYAAVDVILHLHIFTRLQKTDVAITVFR